MGLKDKEAGCDLLENYYLCSINNSLLLLLCPIAFVVICLKTTTFVVSTTVNTENLPDVDSL